MGEELAVSEGALLCVPDLSLKEQWTSAQGALLTRPQLLQAPSAPRLSPARSLPPEGAQDPPIPFSEF